MTILAIFLQGDILSVDASFLFVFISIILLVFILNATLFKPINRVLEERDRLSRGRMSETRQLLAQYEERLQKYEGQIRAARAEAYQYAEEQRRQALAKQQELIAQVKTEVSQQIAAARQEIGAQSAAAKSNLEQEARQMAAQISSQILHRPVNTPEGI
ncbi:MAG TPA: hypothetical protein VEF04_03420 [Blastocatellia bacterium]|nr:hypothetical protein [Blastocatellia bacterium]